MYIKKVVPKYSKGWLSTPQKETVLSDRVAYLPFLATCRDNMYNYTSVHTQMYTYVLLSTYISELKSGL